MRKLVFLLLPFLGIFACHKELSPEEQLQDIEKINNYLQENNLHADSTASGLHYIITEPGTGGSPNLQSSVRYTGFLLDGTIFDQTPGSQTATFLLSNLISGWQEGIPSLQKGGKGTFFIPLYIGYGSSLVGPIPSQFTIDF